MSDIAYISDRTGLIVSWIHDGRLCCHSFSREDRLFVAGQLFSFAVHESAILLATQAWTPRMLARE